jgi:uncharacterized repeat protein (TIGR03843 family)
VAGIRHWRSDVAVTTADAIRALGAGELTVAGRITEASNVALWCELHVPWELPHDAGSLHVIYKPIRGERPLVDFPVGTLALREEAAWHVSEATGWSIVPPTLVRDGPAGRGMVQLWIDIDEDADILRMILTRDERLRHMAVFDVLVNNADRKGGHLLVTGDDVHGCDHGICFSTTPKLRTVLWGWRGEPLTDEERGALERVCAAIDGPLGERLAPLLDDAEVGALRARAERLLQDGHLPRPDPYQRVVPWPPF